MLRHVSALVGCLIPSALAAQAMSSNDAAAAKAAREAGSSLRYLEAERTLRRAAFDESGKAKPGFVHDKWVEARGLLTGVPGPVAIMPDVEIDGVTATERDRLRKAEARDALQVIVEYARNTRVVFLNEDHASPRDRAFGLEVAKALRPLGYNVLAVETLENVADEAQARQAMAVLQRDGYARKGTGTYTRDPVFADFLRQSLALGYRPVAYETTDDGREGDWRARIDRREQMQSDYLVTRALTSDPNAKVLVYVGFNHASEQPQVDPFDGTSTRWLAMRVKAATGIDPLTIDQTVLNAYGAGDTAAHKAVATKIGDRSSILFERGKPLVVGQFVGRVDLQVAHPLDRMVAGRPAWLAAMNRKPVVIDEALLPKTGERLVQAFMVTEGPDTIPIDQVLVVAGEPKPALMLPDAPVRYAVQD